MSCSASRRDRFGYSTEYGVTITFELLGGLAVLAGAYIPLISVPLTAILLVAVFTVHLPYGFTSIKLRAVTAAGPQFGPPGYETNVLYIAALATLILGGPGPLALGSRRARAWSDGARGSRVSETGDNS